MPVAKKSYLEFYRDPRWQKKRLEVMERDRFMCTGCEAEDKTLNVHHCYYENGMKPWEYELSSLITLCEECHEKEKDAAKDAKAELLGILGFYGFRAALIQDIAGILQEVAASIGAGRTIHEMYEWQIALERSGKISHG